MQLFATEPNNLQAGKAPASQCRISESFLLLYLWCAVHKLVLPEIVDRILYQLNEGDEQPPGVWTVHYQPLQQHTSDLLLDGLCICFSKQRQQSTTEVVCVAVGIAELVGNGIEEQVAT